MNKYTETVQKHLESEKMFGNLFCVLDDEFDLELSWSHGVKLGELTIKDHEHKLTYVYLLSIVDQETADEMIELLKEPV